MICVRSIKKQTKGNTHQLISRTQLNNAKWAKHHVGSFSWSPELKVQFQSGELLSFFLLPEGKCLAAPSLFTASLTLSQEETRHILVNHKSDAAGGSDADHVGNDAFVEAGGAFIPARGEEDITQEGTFHVISTRYWPKMLFFCSFGKHARRLKQEGRRLITMWRLLVLPPGILASTNSPKTCMWGKWETLTWLPWVRMDCFISPCGEGVYFLLDSFVNIFCFLVDMPNQRGQLDQRVTCLWPVTARRVASSTLWPWARSLTRDRWQSGWWRLLTVTFLSVCVLLPSTVQNKSANACLSISLAIY